jgi:hypothetical protein
MTIWLGCVTTSSRWRSGFLRMAEAVIEALRRQRREPSIQLEQALPAALRVVRSS